MLILAWKSQSQTLFFSGQRRLKKTLKAFSIENHILYWKLDFLNIAFFQSSGPLGWESPKGPWHTKNSTHSEFTICSEFATRSDALLKM